MSTGYDRPEPPVHDLCKYCKDEVYEKDYKVHHGGELYCNPEHLGEHLIKIGLAEWRVAGE